MVITGKTHWLLILATGTAALDLLDAFTKYHLGCGSVLVPGYLNIDRFAGLEPGRLYQQVQSGQTIHILNYDLAKGIPGCGETLEVIYLCHFLEHLPYPAALELLRQARARLKPGGRLRLLVPDLELWIDRYQKHDTAFFDAYRRQSLGDDRAVYPTRATVFMAMLTGFGHQWAYDFESLEGILRSLGFAQIGRTLFQESALPEIRIIEPYTPLRGMESLCVECVRG
jgi:SAM-dependent methyltransferase